MLSKKWIRRLDWTLAFLLIFGVAVHSLGTAANALVISANHGLMPTMGEVPDENHTPVDEQTRFVFLADRFVIEHPIIDEKVLPGFVAKIYRVIAKYLDLPREGLYSASIGDLMRWSGAALFLIMIPPVLVRIPFRLFRDGIRFQWRKRKK